MSTLFRPRSTCRSALRLAACLLLTGTAVVAARPAFAEDVTHLTIPQASAMNEHVSIALNKSMIVDLPADAHEVIISQPAIAGATMRSKRRVILQGVGAGETNLFFIDDQGRQIATLDVSVVRDSSTLSAMLAQALPGSAITVQNFGGGLVLSGTVLSQDDSTKAAAIAGQFIGSGSGAASSAPAASAPGGPSAGNSTSGASSVTNVTNILTISGPQQVSLKVTVAEVERSAVKQLGLDLAGALSVGQLTTGLVNTSSLGAASGVVSGTGNLISNSGLPTGIPAASGDSIGAGINIPGLSLAATLHALEQRNLLRTLDSPTLTAMSGQAAELDAGGQIPVINPPDQSGQVSYSYKQIGVKLNFTPVVKSNGLIDLTVDSSVTDIDNTFSVSVAGISIPGLNTREAKTVVELPAGSTLSIGGLFEDQMRQEISSLPGVGNIPILGALFRSRDFIHDQTELVILVTPYLARPGAAPALPTDGVVAAGDAETTFLGRMQKLYGVGDPRAPVQPYQGAVGFSLE